MPPIGSRPGPIERYSQDSDTQRYSYTDRENPLARPPLSRSFGAVLCSDERGESPPVGHPAAQGDQVGQRREPVELAETLGERLILRVVLPALVLHLIPLEHYLSGFRLEDEKIGERHDESHSEVGHHGPIGQDARPACGQQHDQHPGAELEVEREELRLQPPERLARQVAKHGDSRNESGVDDAAKPGGIGQQVDEERQLLGDEDGGARGQQEGGQQGQQPHAVPVVHRWRHPHLWVPPLQPRHLLLLLQRLDIPVGLSGERRGCPSSHTTVPAQAA
mmetsp:Transcript_5557/g.15515  ORF Transcript_5557/g.15515 Transcript_5557/m.15515 type:complete len:278 (+) Transcript_5557:438-1271(+)